MPLSKAKFLQCYKAHKWSDSLEMVDWALNHFLLDIKDWDSLCSDAPWRYGWAYCSLTAIGASGTQIKHPFCFSSIPALGMVPCVWEALRKPITQFQLWQTQGHLIKVASCTLSRVFFISYNCLILILNNPFWGSFLFVHVLSLYFSAYTLCVPRKSRTGSGG